MGRGEEYVKRKHKRAERKRSRSDSDGGAAELAAAKKRRRKGKRRITEGMCYSLPTAENPFLDEKEKAAFRMTHGKKVTADLPKAKRAKPSPIDPTSADPKLASDKTPKTKRVFWPKGDVGKAHIASASDLRLPEVFRSAAKSLGVREPSDCLSDVWQAALRGLGVWAFTEGSSGVPSAEGELENGGVSGGFSSGDVLLGYLLPVVQHLKAQEEGKMGQGPAVVVLVSSRARGAEVIKACRKIREGGIPLKAVNIHEETGLQEQLEGLQNQVVDLIAATPGRLSQLNIVKGDLLSRATFAVLDSADRMTERDLRQAGLLAESLQSDCQRLFFTGEYNAAVQETQRQWLKDPIQRVASSSSPVALCAGIEQHFSLCTEEKKAQRVVKAVLDVREAESDARVKRRILVMVPSTETADRTVAALGEAGLKAGLRHEDLRTEQRLSAEDDFRAGKVPILVTTSIDAPGLHASNVPVLILHDLPDTVEAYVSLVGHVARTTVKGRVHSLFTKEQAHVAVTLSELLQQCAQPVHPNLEMMARAVRHVRQQQNGTQIETGTGTEPVKKDGKQNRINGGKRDGNDNRNGSGNQSAVANGVRASSKSEKLTEAATREGQIRVKRGKLGNGVGNGTNAKDADGDEASDGGEFASDDLDGEDDEVTIEEEERLGNEEGMLGGDDELRMLEEENAMSVEELLARIRGQQG